MNKIIKTIIVLISIFLMFSVLWIQLDFKTPSHLVSFSDSEKSWIRANPIITVAIDPSFAPYEFKQDDQYLGHSTW